MGAFRYMANLDQDRRDARAWAQEWHIKQKNMKIFRVIAVIAVIAALYFIINFVIVHATRTTYGSVEEMRAALQGRFETDYCEDMEIIDQPAWWGNHSEYRLLNPDPNVNFFRVKAASITAAH